MKLIKIVIVGIKKKACYIILDKMLLNIDKDALNWDNKGNSTT